MQSMIFSFPSEGSGNRTASRMAFSSMPRASMIEGASSVSSSTKSGPPTTDGLYEDVVDVSDEMAHRATVLVAAPVMGVRLGSSWTSFIDLVVLAALAAAGELNDCISIRGDRG